MKKALSALLLALPLLLCAQENVRFIEIADDNHTVMVHPPGFRPDQAFASRHDLYKKLERVGEGRSQGLGGSTENQAVLMPQVLIGAYELNEVPVDLELPSDRQHRGWGIFGMEVLKRFNVVPDFRNDSIFLRPTGLLHAPCPRPFGRELLIAFAGSGLMALPAILYFVRRRTKAKRRAA